MKLSDLLKQDPMPERAFGIVVDVEDFDPPAGLGEISFVAPLGPDGIDTDVLDVAISYLLTKKIEVTFEFAAEVPIKDPKYLVQLGTSIGAAISLLPPETDDEDAFWAYVQRLEGFVAVYGELANVSKPLLPITSYLEYLVVEMLDPASAANFTPTDPYVIERFASVMTLDRSDAMKERLREAFERYYGGREAFESHYRAQVAMIYAENEAVLNHVVQSQAAQDEAATVE